MTPAEFSPAYLAALEAEAKSTVDASQPAVLPPAVRALDAPPQPPLGWIVDGLWPAGKIGLFVGDGGAFKSSAALHIACAIAGGYPVFERYRVESPRPVLIVSAEDELSVVLMRLEAFIAGHGWDRERVLGNVHIIADAEPSLGEAAWKLHLIGEVERIAPGFIILDPWADLLGGDENSNTDARPAIKFLRRLAAISDAGVGVVHHAGKQGANGEKRALDRIRGASALPSAARVILFFEFRPDGVYVENLKMSRAPRLESFLIRRDIKTADDNHAVWSSAKLTLQAALPFAEQWVIDRLRETRHAETKPTSAELRTMADGIAGLRKQDLAAAMQRLYARGVTTFTEGKRNARHWRLVDPNFQPPQLEMLAGNGSKRPDPAHPAQMPGQGTRRDPAHSYTATGYAVGSALTLPGQGKIDPAHPAQTHLGRLARDPAPPKGGGQGVTHTSRAGKRGQGQPDPWADGSFTPSDAEAELDERRGLQEG